MIRNYLHIAWRNLLRNRTFSVINIIGLAVGLACFLLITLFVLDELSYDRYNEKADRIFRVNVKAKFGGADLNFPLSADMMGQALKKDYPAVEEYTRIYNSSGPKLIKKGNSYIKEENVCHADSSLFNVFTLPAVDGDTRTALNAPNTVVITQKMAKKYFGTTDAVGQLLETTDGKGVNYKVTAVIKDLPANSHFNFDFFFSMKNVDYAWGQYLSHNFHTYLLLKKGFDYKQLENKFPEYEEKYVLPEIRFMGITSMEQFKSAGNLLEYSLTPLTQIHLYSDRQYEFLPPGNIQYVFIFAAVALFILLIACVNFMNLSTARSIKQAKEVGIRKVLGTQRKGLITRFLTESVLMVFLSMILALAITLLILPVFNDISGKELSRQNLFSIRFIPFLIGLPVVVGLLAGAYPAFFLSSFKPIEVLKGKLRLTGGSGALQSGLVVFQFFSSIVLIIGTIVIYRQLNYIQTRNIGFNKNQVLIVDNTNALKQNVHAFETDVKKLSGVKTAAISGFLPISPAERSDEIYARAPTMDVKNGLDFQSWQIDYDYIMTFGMQLLKGRDFSRDFGTDTSGVIINETAAAVLGYKDPIGKKIYSVGDNPKAFTVIGVIRNFNFESLRQSVGPLALFLGENTASTSFKVSATKTPDLLTEIENHWRDLAPGMPFSYRFLDVSFNNMYKSEQRIGKIVLIFSVLAILIACLGLFGLSTFIAEQRTREIGIRKVLGASINSIVTLLSKEFILLVGIAFIIALPVSWWVMNKWLMDFAYRTTISWWIFLLAGALSLGIALFTMSFQAIRAALMNPTKSLRTE